MLKYEWALQIIFDFKVYEMNIITFLGTSPFALRKPWCSARRLIAASVNKVRRPAKYSKPITEEEGDDAATQNSTATEVQYARLKKENPDHLVLYQKGNFYEMWGDDAVKAARLLKLRLSLNGMAGFPVHTGAKWFPQFHHLGV